MSPRVTRTAAKYAALYLAVSLVAVATPASADFLDDQLNRTKAESKQVKHQISATEQRSTQITKQIESYSQRIERLQAPIDELDAKVNNLEQSIEQRQQRIVYLRRLFIEQRREIQRLGSEIIEAQNEYMERLVAIYEEGGPNYSEWISGARDPQELIQRAQIADDIANAHVTVLARVRLLQRKVRVERARNHEAQAEVRSQMETIQHERDSVAQARYKLQKSQDRIALLRGGKKRALGKLRTLHGTLESRLDNLDKDSAALKAAIENGGIGVIGGGQSVGGLIWPVNGSVVSPFGWRWGRMHQGIDIAASTGTPIHASAAGVVIHSTWMDGYGQLVLVQHSGSLVTAYAHQSQIIVAKGQVVSQGQVLGFVGCTGHCFGPHLHFEVRVGGGAVDPMRYL